MSGEGRSETAEQRRAERLYLDPMNDAPDSDLHTRGEFVLGLGWSCIECDTFGCPVTNEYQP